MKATFKRWARYTLERAGYRITRVRPANRFQAMDETLLLLRGFGYAPRVIIDGGANMGAWARMAHGIFPQALIHLVEPQAACAPALEKLVSSTPGLVFHRIAITEPGATRVRMLGGGRNGGSTGARVAAPYEQGDDEVEYAATSLDALFSDRIGAADRTLLKLDLEGHELAALRGGQRLLDAVEVVLTELQFFEINDNGRPVFADILNFLRTCDFELYDFACLSQRPRDMRLRMGDVVFARRDSALLSDRSWE